MEGALDEAAKSTIEIVLSRATDEINLIRHSKVERKRLQHKIERMACILLEMSGNVRPSQPLDSWLRDTLRIIYNAEDLFDVLAYEYHRAVVIKQRSKRPFFGNLNLFFSPSNPIVQRHKIGKWVRSINTDLEQLLKDARDIYDLKSIMTTDSPFQTGNFRSEVAAAENALQQIRRHADMSLFIGRNSAVDSVVDMLCKPFINSNSFSVVAITGLGGIGKTTLAKKVFENKQVTGHFTERIWVAVSQEFDISEILNKMLEFVDKKNSRNGSGEMAMRTLKENLDGKRVLIVLDDAWNTDHTLWNSMKSSLESIGCSKESMILVTARDRLVANTMNASRVYHLPELSEDDSWSLFKHIAFANMNQQDISLVETTGKRIVKKCEGVPLAVKAIGGMLRTKSADKWQEVEQSEIWDLPQGDTGVLPSLKLSYDHLSPFLKKCFSFCAIFPKDDILDKSWLTQSWIDLGLIQQSDARRLMEDIAQEYINALLNISFLHEYKWDDELGEAIQYGMHNLVHDLARLVSRQELLQLEESTQVTRLTTMSDVRHLASDGKVEVTAENWDQSILENLRTLDMHNRILTGILEHVKYLRVLCLWNSGLQELPRSVARLKCLKSLCLASNPIEVLPDFITELYNLQSLFLDNCEQLQELPRGLKFLVNMRHLSFDRFIHIPEGIIEQLISLQTLPPLWVNEGGFQISELRGLCDISDLLKIRGLEFIKSKDEAKTANLSEKSRIKRLRLIWDSDDDWMKHEEVLDGLKPNRNLRLLAIQGYGGEKFPSWLLRMDVPKENNCNGGVYSLIRMIELVDCKRCQQLPTLGHLPCLEKLKIANMVSLEKIGSEFYHHANMLTEVVNSSSSSGLYFGSLKELHLCGLPNLVEWCELGCSGFPLLEILFLEDCPQLTITPSKFPSLKQLTVKNITSDLLLSNISTNKSSLNSLRNVHIEEVEELMHLPEALTQYCTSLHTLRIHRCRKLAYLSKCLSKLLSLEVLQIKECPNLVSLPNLKGLGLLRELEINSNYGLESVPKGLQSCYSLERLWFYFCPKVETLPDLAGLTRLSNLCIKGMTKMISQVPEWMYTLPSLRILHIGDYDELKQFPDLSCLLKITSLRVLSLYGWTTIRSLPTELQQFTALERLLIADFDNVKCLPDWIQNLSSLQALYLTRCANLKELPTAEAMNRLTKLMYLYIWRCPLLEENIKPNFPEHHKIAPQVRVHIRK